MKLTLNIMNSIFFIYRNIRKISDNLLACIGRIFVYNIPNFSIHHIGNLHLCCYKLLGLMSFEKQKLVFTKVNIPIKIVIIIRALMKLNTTLHKYTYLQGFLLPGLLPHLYLTQQLL